MVTIRIEEMGRLGTEDLMVQEPLQIRLMTAETLKVKVVSGTGEVIMLLHKADVVSTSQHDLRKFSVQLEVVGL